MQTFSLILHLILITSMSYKSSKTFPYMFKWNGNTFMALHLCGHFLHPYAYLTKEAQL